MRMCAFNIRQWYSYCECGISVEILGCVHDNRLVFYAHQIITNCKQNFSNPFIKFPLIEHFYSRSMQNMCMRMVRVRIELPNLEFKFTSYFACLQIHPKSTWTRRRRRRRSKKWAKTNRESMGVLPTPHLLRRPRFLLRFSMGTWFLFHKCEKIRRENLRIDGNRLCPIDTSFWCVEFLSSNGNHIHGTMHG